MNRSVSTTGSYNKQHININTPSKQLWRNIKRLGVSKNISSSVNCSNTADEINEYFSPNCTTESNSFENVYANSDGFFFRIIEEYEIVNAMFTVKSNAVGLDNVPIKFLKIMLPLVLPLIKHLFNLIITTAKFPQGWKCVKVIPIKKNVRSSDINNLRPISILSALSKVFEKLIKIQISDFINEMNLLNPFQSGFRKNHSTDTALIKVHDDIARSIDKKGVAILLLIDFAKAFDRVSHTKLINKLISKFSFNTSAANLIKSYLSDRSQAVYYNGEISSFRKIDSGVPQGSVLGPLLFSLFINDLPSVLEYCTVHLFADDVQIYLCVNDFTDMARISWMINHDLNKILCWSRRNLLPINSSKTKAMMLSRLKNPPEPPRLYLNDEPVEFVDHARNLGLIFKNSLEWDTHINSQVGKIYGALKQLNLVTKEFDIPTKTKLFKTLIYPYFLYGDFVYTNASVASLEKLRVALNSCVRYVFNISRYNRVSHLQTNLLGCPFSQFYKYRSCVTIFRIIHTKRPEYLFNKLIPFRNSRTKSYLIPHHSSVYYSQSLFARGIVFWNHLPLTVKSSSSIPMFKKGLLSELNNLN